MSGQTASRLVAAPCGEGPGMEGRLAYGSLVGRLSASPRGLSGHPPTLIRKPLWARQKGARRGCNQLAKHRLAIRTWEQVGHGVEILSGAQPRGYSSAPEQWAVSSTEVRRYNMGALFHILFETPSLVGRPRGVLKRQHHGSGLSLMDAAPQFSPLWKGNKTTLGLERSRGFSWETIPSRLP